MLVLLPPGHIGGGSVAPQVGLWRALLQVRGGGVLGQELLDVGVRAGSIGMRLGELGQALVRGDARMHPTCGDYVFVALLLMVVVVVVVVIGMLRSGSRRGRQRVRSCVRGA